MEKCLVKTLKRVINANIPKMDELIINLKSTSYYYALILEGEEFTVTAGAGGGFTTTVPSAGDTPITTYTGTSATLYCIGGNYPIHISNKYNLTRLKIYLVKSDGANAETAADPVIVINLSDLEFMTSLLKLELYKTGSGDLTSIARMTNLAYLYCTYGDAQISAPLPSCKISQLFLQGNHFNNAPIASFATSNILSVVNLMSNGIVGSIEDFVESMVDVGVTSNNITSFQVNTAITFGNTNVFKNCKKINWSSKTKMFITNSSNTAIQCLGYTPEEIEANRAGTGTLDWRGITVTDVSTDPVTVYDN